VQARDIARGKCSAPHSSSIVWRASAFEITTGARTRCPFSSSTPTARPARRGSGAPARAEQLAARADRGRDERVRERLERAAQ
jgi:hypothetical protein